MLARGTSECFLLLQAFLDETLILASRTSRARSVQHEGWESALSPNEFEFLHAGPDKLTFRQSGDQEKVSSNSELVESVQHLSITAAVLNGRASSSVQGDGPTTPIGWKQPSKDRARQRPYNSPRGSRGRAYSKRREAGEAQSQSESMSRTSSASQGQDGQASPTSVTSKSPTHNDGWSSTTLSRAPSQGTPRGPRVNNGSFRAPRSAGNWNSVGSHGMKQEYAGQPRYAPLYGGMLPMPGTVAAWNAYPPPSPMLPYSHGPPMPMMSESTSSEFGPTGTSSMTEPTHALLLQIEYYFSHQNLQGDFFLRKSMDASGFVPIDVVAGFNRVRRIAGESKSNLIRDTLLFSRVLQLDEERNRVRKSIGWESYVLEGGEHPQQLPREPAQHTPAPVGASLPMLNGFAPSNEAALSPNFTPSSFNTSFPPPSPYPGFPMGMMPPFASPSQADGTLRQLHQQIGSATPSYNSEQTFGGGYDTSTGQKQVYATQGGGALTGNYERGPGGQGPRRGFGGRGGHWQQRGGHRGRQQHRRGGWQAGFGNDDRSHHGEERALSDTVQHLREAPDVREQVSVGRCTLR